MKKIFKALAAVLIIVFGLLVFLFGFLQSDGGRTLLARTLSATLSDGPDNRVSITGIAGTFPVNFQVESITVAARRGEWLEIAGLRVKISLPALLRRRLELEDLAARSLTLNRLPPSGPENGRQASSGFRLPASWPRFAIRRLSLPRLELGEDVIGEEAHLVVSGRFLCGPVSGLDMDLSAGRIDRNPGVASLRMKLAPGYDRFDLDASVREGRESLLTELISPGATGPFTFSARGEGPIPGWSGQIRFDSPDLGQARGELKITGSAARPEMIADVSLSDCSVRGFSV